MYTINLEFETLKDARILDYINGTIGVYILWKPSVIKPSYIGQGNILERLVNHTGWLEGYDGIIARTGKLGKDESKAELDAALSEAFIINLARVKNYHPTWNLDRGMVRILNEQVNEYNGVKISFSGNHPFRRPGGGHCNLGGKVPVTLTYSKEDGMMLFDCPWHDR